MCTTHNTLMTIVLDTLIFGKIYLNICSLKVAFHVIFSIQAPHLCTSVSCLSMAPCYGDKLTWTLDSPVHNAVDCSCFLALFNICHCQPAGGGLNLSEEKGGVGST